MSEALKRAREEAAEKLEAAKDDFDAMNRRNAEFQARHDERRADWAARIEEAQATLHAIDAAIEAEAPLASLKPKGPTIEIGFPFGDGEELKIRATVEDLKELVGSFATSGIAGSDVEPRLVGERPGETLLFSGYVDRKTVADEVDKKEWSVFGAATTAVDEPFFDLGDCVRVDTKGSGPLSGMSAIGIVVEIGTLGARRTYRVDFPYGFGLQDSFFGAADLTRINRPDWL